MMRSKQEAVEDVQTISVGLAFRPGDGVAGSKNLWNGNACHGTSASPVVHQTFPVDVLTDSLPDGALDLGIGYRGGDFLFDFREIADFRLVGR